MSSNIEVFHWYPISSVITGVEDYCKKNNYKDILEIGPGTVPFSLATKIVGCNEKVKDYIDIDIDVKKLPFDDKSLDFTYSRHTLEDIQNPDFAMNEIIRVSKSGFIETPSPLIEITKGVDGQDKRNNYAGYCHHRYIVWSDIEKCEIHFLPKYNTIIDNYISIKLPKEIYKDQFNWNNYFIWHEQTPKVIMHKNGVTFNTNNTFIKDYTNLINEAVLKSIQNTIYFREKYDIK
jgi:hypothetical protein